MDLPKVQFTFVPAKRTAPDARARLIGDFQAAVRTLKQGRKSNRTIVDPPKSAPEFEGLLPVGEVRSLLYLEAAEAIEFLGSLGASGGG